MSVFQLGWDGIICFLLNHKSLSSFPLHWFDSHSQLRHSCEFSVEGWQSEVLLVRPKAEIGPNPITSRGQADLVA